MKYTKIDQETLKISFNKPINDNKFDIQSDKYLYNGNKTIGFRKDKNLNKFVGLRDGDSKQMEFSIKSIIIDGIEKIHTNQSYFNDIELINDVVIHKINDIEIYNKINGTNYRNLVKINDMFDNISITYIVDLKGIKIINKFHSSNNKKTYIETYENNYIVVDKYNNNKYFIIDNPIVFTENDDVLNIVQHELYEIDNILYYKKTITDFKHFNGNNNHLPIYVDANIKFNVSSVYYTINKTSDNIILNDFTIDNYYTIWKDFIRKKDNSSYSNSINGTNLIKCDVIPYNLSFNVAKNVKLSRHYFSFDTSKLSKYGDIVITGANFNFYYGNKTLPIKLSLQKSIFLGNIPNKSEWLSYSNEAYKIKDSSINSFSGTTVLTVSNDDININGLTNFVLRSFDYDYNTNIPTESLLVNIDNTIINSSLDVYFKVSLNEPITIKIIPDEIKVISSSGSGTNAYDIVKSGITTLVVHSSNKGVYNNAFGYKFNNINNTPIQTLNRTYLMFDTSILNFYTDNNVIKNIKLKFVSFEQNRPIVSLYKNTNNNDTLSWNDTMEHIGNFPVNNVGVETSILLSNEDINNSESKFVLIDDYFDRLGNFQNIIDSFTNGIDFSTIEIEVIIEPYLIKGINYKQVLNNETFQLNASKNISGGTIKWYDDYRLTNQIGQGYTISLNSIFYKNNDIIYAIIVDNSNNKISKNTLEVKLDIRIPKYNTLPILNRPTSYDVVDLDSVYFKYENAISGICYSYFRDLEDVYESSKLVSDGDDIGSYNLYNEFDIIDEFYSNVSEVELVYKLDDIDLNISYKELDGNIIHEGTRVLLYSKIPSDDDGIYVANYNLKFIKSEVTTDDNKLFRFKVNVNSGTYLDYEFHTYYYDYDVNINNPSNNTFNFDVFDSSLYSDVIMDMSTYYDRIYDSNI